MHLIMQDGAVTVEEFQSSLKNVCQGKDYDDLPSSFKQWIVAMFNTIDTDGNASNMVSISTLEKMFDSLLNLQVMGLLV